MSLSKPKLLAASTTASSHLQPDQGPGSLSNINSANTSRRQRKNVSVACGSCQQKRIKCSGELPCRSCMQQVRECVYTEDNDARRRPRRKRKVEELQKDSELLSGLIHTIRNGDNNQVDQLMSLIRSDVSLEELHLRVKQPATTDTQLMTNHRVLVLEGLHIQAVEQLPDGGELEDFRPHPRRRSSNHRNVLGIERLTDSPPLEVPAFPWTTVTGDNGLVSNLISVWLAWGKPCCDWISEDLFLRDMRQCNMSAATYCSRFLVNALLAAACAYSDYDEVKTQNGAFSPVMIDFFTEACTLLKEIEASEDEPSITTAQGLGFMSLAVGVTARDSVGFSYIRQALSVCERIQKEYAIKHSSPSVTEEEEIVFSRILDTTCWGIFNFFTIASLVHQLPHDVPAPSGPIPPSRTLSSTVTPYPQAEPSFRAYSDDVLHHRCHLSVLSREACVRIHEEMDKKNSPPVYTLDTVLLRHHTQLVQWRDSLPAHLQADESSSPGVLMLQLFYNTTMIMILDALKDNTKPDASEQSPTTTTDQQARRALSRREAALTIVQLCRYYESAYGATYMNAFMISSIFSALLVLLLLEEEEEEQQDILPYQSEIADLCIYFRAISRRWPSFTLVALREFQVSVRQPKKGKKLPPEVEKLFEEFVASGEDQEEEEEREPSLQPTMVNRRKGPA